MPCLLRTGCAASRLRCGSCTLLRNEPTRILLPDRPIAAGAEAGGPVRLSRRARSVADDLHARSRACATAFTHPSFWTRRCAAIATTSVEVGPQTRSARNVVHRERGGRAGRDATLEVIARQVIDRSTHCAPERTSGYDPLVQARRRRGSVQAHSGYLSSVVVVSACPSIEDGIAFNN
jgi:hypothetical protein